MCFGKDVGGCLVGRVGVVFLVTWLLFVGLVGWGGGGGGVSFSF